MLLGVQCQSDAFCSQKRAAGHISSTRVASQGVYLTGFGCPASQDHRMRFLTIHSHLPTNLHQPAGCFCYFAHQALLFLLKGLLWAAESTTHLYRKDALWPH